MTAPLRTTLVSLSLAMHAACGIEDPEAEDASSGTTTAPEEGPGSTGEPDASTSSALEGSGTDMDDPEPGTGDSGGPAAAGLPCDIDDLLDRRCRTCHGATPVGAPMPLVSHADLVAPSPSDPSATVAEQALLRMASADAPMPPAPASPATADERAAFASWVESGMPMGDCSDDEPEFDPFDVEPTCSTGRFWDPDDDDGTPRMFPGRACLSCHELEAPDDDDVPNLLIGGTVFQTAHEPDDCLGPPGELDGEAIVVEVTADDGQVITLQVNDSGNFLMHASQTPFPAPYLVKVVHGDEERAMPIPAPSGNCNACHTQDGLEGAPGRIVLP